MTEGDQTGGDLRTALHSYVHYARRPERKAYFKLPRDAAGAKAWSVPDLCAAYGWPTELAGGGVIAIVELDGGWVESDMAQFFELVRQPLPQITDVSVDGTRNNPNQHRGDPRDPDGEVALDIEVAAAAYCAATGKPAVVRVYWAQDIPQAVRAAAADGCDVCSISWGADEAKWGRQAGELMETVASEATAAGMVVFAASGDNDSSDGGPNPANVDLPASAPHVIGCGGTSKTATSETVWNNDPGNPSGQGTGGGYSRLFRPMPDWQLGAPHGRGRMVPDVAANADPGTGYKIIVHGAPMTIGGTSAVAPLYSGLFAAFGEKLGFVSPELWENQTCFNDVTQGDNGAYRSRIGPDPCTGLGSPIGSKLARLLIHPAAKCARKMRHLEEENATLRRRVAELSR